MPDFFLLASVCDAAWRDLRAASFLRPPAIIWRCAAIFLIHSDGLFEPPARGFQRLHLKPEGASPRMPIAIAATTVAKVFIPHYYNLFDTNREGLASLFRNESQFTFEGDGPKAGAPAIMEKLRTLPAQHQPQTIETQPSTTRTRILVLLHGQHPCGAGQAPQIPRSVPARRVGAGSALPAQRHLPIQLRQPAGPVLVRSPSFAGASSRRSSVHLASNQTAPSGRARPGGGSPAAAGHPAAARRRPARPGRRRVAASRRGPGRRTEPGRRPAWPTRRRRGRPTKARRRAARRRRPAKARRRRPARRRRRAKAWRATRRARITALLRVAALLAGPGIGLLRPCNRALHFGEKTADARSRPVASRGDLSAEATPLPRRVTSTLAAGSKCPTRRWLPEAPRRSPCPWPQGTILAGPARVWRSARSSSRRRPSRGRPTAARRRRRPGGPGRPWFWFCWFRPRQIRPIKPGPRCCSCCAPLAHGGRSDDAGLRCRPTAAACGGAPRRLLRAVRRAVRPHGGGAPPGGPGGVP